MGLQGVGITGGGRGDEVRDGLTSHGGDASFHSEKDTDYESVFLSGVV